MKKFFTIVLMAIFAFALNANAQDNKVAIDSKTQLAKAAEVAERLCLVDIDMAALEDGEHTIICIVTDGSGRTTQTVQGTFTKVDENEEAYKRSRHSSQNCR